MIKVAFHTLGCKVNQVETEQLKEAFLQLKYEIVDFGDVADIYVINTCTVTHVSDRKSRAMIRRAVKHNPEAIVVAIGCGAQVNTVQLAAIEGLNLLVGNKYKDQLPDLVADYLAKGKTDLQVLVEPILSSDKPVTRLYSQHHERTRAFVKIQDGCQSFCSYCIVPFARGPVRSKSPENVIAEITNLLEIGYKEIVLTGIHTGFYGVDLEDWNLNRLLKRIFAEVEGEYRIRLGSIEPKELNEELLQTISSEPRMCRHLHIPLQSGSDRILASMGRRYDRNYYRELVLTAAEKIPGAAFTADVIVGYPTEQDMDFQDTYDLINELPIYDLHVFKYSIRQGTRAATLVPQVKEADKHSRSERLIQLGTQKKEEFKAQCIGQTLPVLVERKVDETQYLALSDNYIDILFESQQDLRGQIVNILLTEVGENKVRGKLCINDSEI